METIVDLNPETDPLAIFEAKIRTVGAWCRVVKDFHYRHMMISKNPKATVAISRCGQIIAPFDKLVEDTETKKCLVCSLYDKAGEEVKLRTEKTLVRLADETETQPKPNKE